MNYPLYLLVHIQHIKTFPIRIRDHRYKLKDGIVRTHRRWAFWMQLISTIRTWAIGIRVDGYANRLREAKKGWWRIWLFKGVGTRNIYRVVKGFGWGRVVANERQGHQRELTCSRHVNIPGNLIMLFHYEHCAHHSTSTIWMTSRSHGTLYRWICMFNVVSVAYTALAPLSLSLSFFKTGMSLNITSLLADVNVSKKNLLLLYSPTRSS